MVTTASKKQHSNVGSASESPDPEVSLLHFLCNRHRGLNELLDKLEPLLVERGELIRQMQMDQFNQDIWRVERELASLLTSIQHVSDQTRRQIATICRGDTTDDLPF